MMNRVFRRGRPELDPTLVRSQPALRTSSGAIWIIVASLFTAVCLVPLIGIIGRGGAPAGIAIATAVLLVGLLAAMVVLRLTVSPGPALLRALAVCFIAMALVVLAGMITCVLLVWAPPG
ncbi:hypothetical protein [Microbacterium hydrocarbonoxydans]|uniref:hypothetical protein n=1 Tax=Microbacterium hydrocarbonoxydans TaxID=273678 RepID=UPI0007BB7551|nr:hypothetical protein [Microbacterium hydrocarbonoxydans]GAT73182.1 kinase-like protein [Microbacterium sp. HM58-2]